VDISLNKAETKQMLQLLLKRTREDHLFNNKDGMSISLFLEWNSISHENLLPDAVIIHFNEMGLTMWKDGTETSVCHTKSSPQTIESIKPDIQETISISENEELARRYQEQKGFGYADIFFQKEFQGALTNPSEYKHIEDFFNFDNERWFTGSMRRERSIISS
jgi:hypothetical protein